MGYNGLLLSMSSQQHDVSDVTLVALNWATRDISTPWKLADATNQALLLASS